MRELACSTLSIEGFGETDFSKTFEMAPKIGFRNLEFNCWYPSSLTSERVASLKERCRRYGLFPAAIHLSGGFGGDLCKDFCHKVCGMEAAAALGARRVVASGAVRGEEGGLEAVIRSLRQLAPVAEKMGLLLCLENHCGNNLETIEDYRRVLSAVPSPSVGICVDTGHFDASGVDMDALIDELGERINHIHLKENFGIGEKHFTRFGEGTTGNRHVLEKIFSRGYSGYFSIELSPEIGENDGRPFTQADLELPWHMFSPFEEREPNAGLQNRVE